MTPSPDDVTVIVCSRDRPEMLRAALTSVQQSSPPEVGVLVVDSGSATDETREVAADAGVDYVRAQRGLSIARNAGLTTADRPIVIFTDDDCHPAPGWIEAALPHFLEPEVATVTGRMLDHTVSEDAPYHRPARYERPVTGIDAGHGAVMAFRREALLRIGGFDDALGAGQPMAGAEDLDIFTRLLLAGTAIVHEPGCLVRHTNTRAGEAYVRLHEGYGRGLGAYLVKHFRLRPVLGLRLGWRLKGRTLVRIVRGLRRRRPVAHDVALVRGMAVGAATMWRVPIVGERFIPPWQSRGLPPLDAAGLLISERS
ncbi:glycosyltransferase [Microbacterium sp. NPDC077184]|uniref:glycosyltransferase family 2 protein n=1 Tax=Microbacterium sp. NPDC077184 TaxID=3154764 RepID=UPI003413A470